MKYIIKPHAEKRARERLISEAAIADALENPTKAGYDAKGRLLIKKLYQRGGKERLLLLVGEIVENTLEIITIVDTSKVKKYL